MRILFSFLQSSNVRHSSANASSGQHLFISFFAQEQEERERECVPLSTLQGREERAGDGQLIDLPQVIREEGKQEQQRLFIVIVNQGEEERFNNILLLLFLGNQHSV